MRKITYFLVAIQKIYYVIFTDGLQRTILFTDDPRETQLAEKSIKLNRANLDVQVELSGVSLSFVDSEAKKELAYFAIVSSGKYYVHHFH